MSVLIGSAIGVTGRCESRDLDERRRQRAAGRRAVVAGHAIGAMLRGRRPTAVRSRARRGGAEQVGRGPHHAAASGCRGRASGRFRARRSPPAPRGQRVDQAARDQQPRPQHADQRHQRRVGVDLRSRDAGAGKRERTRRPHPGARAPDGAAPRGHAAHDGRARAAQRAPSARAVSVMSNPSTTSRGSYLPVRRHEDDADEERERSRPAGRAAANQKRPIGAGPRLMIDPARRAPPRRRHGQVDAEEPGERQRARRAAERRLDHRGLSSFGLPPLFADQPLQLVEQRAIAIRHGIDERRQDRQRLAAIAAAAGSGRARRRPRLDFVARRGRRDRGTRGRLSAAPAIPS